MPPISFTDQVALVTGAGRGLGRAYALALAARGATVVVNDLPPDGDGRPSAADAVVAEITAAGGRAVVGYGSVADRSGANAVVDGALERFDRLDVVVSNAGVIRPAMLEQLTDEQLDLVLDLHLRGTFYVAQRAYPRMRERGYGRIVTTASNAGAFGMAAMTNYAAAKAGVLGFTRALACESGPHGILVNCVLPNAATTISDGNPIPGDAIEDGGTKAYKDRLGDRFRPDAVAPLVVYLASSACTTNGDAYSALAGRYARVVTATTRGWAGDPVSGISAEDVAARIDEIRAPTGFALPSSVRDEYRIVAEQLGERPVAP